MRTIVPKSRNLNRALVLWRCGTIDFGTLELIVHTKRGNYHAGEVLCETVTGYPTNGEKEVKG